MTIRVARKIQAHDGYVFDANARQAAVFAGGGINGNTTDQLDFGNSSTLSVAQQFTIEIVLRPYQLRSLMGILAHWNVGSNSARWALTNGSGAAAGRLILQLSGTGSDSPITGNWLSNNAVIAADTVTHLLIAFDLGNANQQARVNVYANGVAVVGAASTPPSSMITNSTSHLVVGCWPGQSFGTAIPYFGEARGLRFYSRLLSATEAARRYIEVSTGAPFYDGAGAHPVSTASLILHAPLDGDALDESGTLQGFGTQTPAAPLGPRFVQMFPEGNSAALANGFRLACLGDSITAGSQWDANDSTNPKCAWRLELWNRIRYGADHQASGSRVVREIRFVGTQPDISPPSYWPVANAVSDGVPGRLLRDPSNNAGQLNTSLYAAIPTILGTLGTAWDGMVLLGGTNDLGHSYTAAQTAQHLTDCLNLIASTQSIGAKPIFVSTITPYAAVSPNDATYNGLIAGASGVIATARAAGINAIYVPMGSALSNPQDFASDAIHPNRAGYAKMATILSRYVAPFLTS